MKNAVTAAVALSMFASAAQAECFTRSVSLNTLTAKIESITDYNKNMFPLGKDKLRCVVTFSAQIAGKWYNTIGEAEGPVDDNTDQICDQAENLGRTKILSSTGGSNLDMKQDLVCTDETKPKLKNVQVGDMVSVSQVSPNPKKPNSFIYMGTECRWFLETVAIGQGGLAQNQGIICLIKDNQWVVRDKWIQVVDK